MPLVDMDPSTLSTARTLLGFGASLLPRPGGLPAAANRAGNAGLTSPGRLEARAPQGASAADDPDDYRLGLPARILDYRPERDGRMRIHRIREDGSQQWVPEDQGPEDTGYEWDDRSAAQLFTADRSGYSGPKTSSGPALASNSLDRRTGRLNYWKWLGAGAERLGMGGTLLEDDTPDLYEREGLRGRPAAMTAAGNPENARMPEESFL